MNKEIKKTNYASENTSILIKMSTTREAEVLQYVSTGINDMEIAKSMGISLKTVETHKYRIGKIGQRDNLTDLASTLPTSSNPSQPQNSPSETATPPQNLADNQVIAPNGDVIDLGQTPENTTTK